MYRTENSIEAIPTPAAIVSMNADSPSRTSVIPKGRANHPPDRPLRRGRWSENERPDGDGHGSDIADGAGHARRALDPWSPAERKRTRRSLPRLVAARSRASSFRPLRDIHGLVLLVGAIRQHECQRGRSETDDDRRQDERLYHRIGDLGNFPPWTSRTGTRFWAPSSMPPSRSDRRTSPGRRRRPLTRPARGPAVGVGTFRQRTARRPRPRGRDSSLTTPHRIDCGSLLRIIRRSPPRR